jgi:hypothetical protein
MDRSWRWQAEFNGEAIPFDRVWPDCTGAPISEAEYRAYCDKQEWARANAPDSAFAQPERKIDPLSIFTPLQF